MTYSWDHLKGNIVFTWRRHFSLYLFGARVNPSKKVLDRILLENKKRKNFKQKYHELSNKVNNMQPCDTNHIYLNWNWTMKIWAPKRQRRRIIGGLNCSAHTEHAFSHACGCTYHTHTTLSVWFPLQRWSSLVSAPTHPCPLSCRISFVPCHQLHPDDHKRLQKTRLSKRP
jgi:hypothetical protein